MHPGYRRFLQACVWVCLCAVIVLPGCKKKGPRYPEDHARFERITEVVDTLHQAYISHDIETTRELLLPLETLQAWEQGIQRDFETYSDISLDLLIERILIQGDLISVFISWQGEWKRTPEDKGMRARGHGILHWSGTHVILLSAVEGDLPFGMADRQAIS